MKHLLLALALTSCSTAPKTPAEVVDGLKLVCAYAPTVPDLPPQVAEACALVQRVTVAEAL